MQVCSDAPRAERYLSRLGRALRFQIRHETPMVGLRTQLAISVRVYSTVHVVPAPVQAFHATDANTHGAAYCTYQGQGDLSQFRLES